MAVESDLCLFNNYVNNPCGNNVRVVLPRTDPFEEYADAKFKERYRLSKSTVFRLLSEVKVSAGSFVVYTHCTRSVWAASPLKNNAGYVTAVAGKI